MSGDRGKGIKESKEAHPFIGVFALKGMVEFDRRK